jgi:hypothetical protein
MTLAQLFIEMLWKILWGQECDGTAIRNGQQLAPLPYILLLLFVSTCCFVVSAIQAALDHYRFCVYFQI